MATKNFDLSGIVFPDDPAGTPSIVAVDQIPSVQAEVKQPAQDSLCLQAAHPIVVLCLDCSYSMSINDSSEGVSRIDLVKRYAKEFVNTKVISELDKEAIDLCVIAFDSHVTIIKDFAPMSTIGDDFSELQATGLTRLYSALIVAVENARKRRNMLIDDGVSCYKPLIYVVTDGRPEGDDEMEESCKKVLHRYVDKDEKGKAKMRLIICGMDQCPMDTMDSLCEDKQIIGLRNTDALKDVFKLITASIAAVSSSEVNDDVHLAFENLVNLGVLKGENRALDLN